jgi:hypothetical protein
MVPVISVEGKPLFPCKERRARCLMDRKEARPYWQKGIFCICLMRKETLKREEYQQISVGIDPGSKMEAYTVATPKSVVLNITTDTKDWVKANVETRRNLRRNRRSRKTPYRKMRINRACLRNRNRMPPSTRTRWLTKLNMVKFLSSIIPITIVNVEDIKAVAKEGKENRRWNAAFSPLEVGKKWFYSEIEKLKLKLILTEGYDTKLHRDKRNFTKSKEKLKYIWETHNVDSHSLAELALGSPVKPFYGLYKMEFLRYHRRQLHVQQPKKGNIRRQYGGTVSLGMPRGSVLKYKGKLCYLGGSSKRGMSIHSIKSGERITQSVKVKDIQMLYTSNRRVQFVPRLEPWVSLHTFS